MYFFVYKTTNLVNGMIYVGIHQTADMNDGYIGSGTLFRQAVEKYGKENFHREILHWASSRSELVELEAEIVNESFVKSKDTYNVTLGGGYKGSYKDLDYYRSGEHLENANSAREKAIESLEDRRKERVEEYYHNPKTCALETCTNPISYEKKNTNRFCSSSCSATHSNTGRVWSSEQRRKVKEKAKARWKDVPTRRKQREERVAAKAIEDRRKMNKVLSLECDFQSRGWVSRVSEAIDISPGSVRRWMKRHMPEFYREKCC